VALSPGDLTTAAAARFPAAAARAVAAGLPGVLLREPGLDDRAWLALFEAVRAATDGAGGVWLAAHDRVHLARAAGADAVHLGFRSLLPGDARTATGGLPLGLSTHAGDEPADWEGADYLFHGPVHATPKAHGPVAPIGFEGLARATRSTVRPILALGGLGPADVAPALAAGAHGVAVLRGVFGASDPAAAAAELRAALDAAPEPTA
jgi:thiamine-phosphate pyrophosphorylase